MSKEIKTKYENNQVILYGKDYHNLGELFIKEITDNTALVITRGAFKKSYSYTDPNEDVVGVSLNNSLSSLFIADGHRGILSSHYCAKPILNFFNNNPKTSEKEIYDFLYLLGNEIRDQDENSRTTAIGASIDENSVLRSIKPKRNTISSRFY